MLVHEFMAPKEECVTCKASDTIETVLDKFLLEKISAVVVLIGDKPAGIVTKTDVARAYKKGFSIEALAGAIMTTDLYTVTKGLPRDKAAEVLIEEKVHHAIVIDEDEKFAGLISAWDVAKEGYLDAKAWPWNRHALA